MANHAYLDLVQWIEQNAISITFTVRRESGLQPECTVYLQNVTRAVSLLLSPARISANAVWNQALADMITLEFYGTLDIETEEKANAVNAEIVRRAPKFKIKIRDNKSPLEAGAKLMDELTQSDEGYAISIHELMSSGIILLWAAFENFAGDLWAAAVNNHPHGLARLSGTWPSVTMKETKKKKRDKENAAALVEENRTSESRKLMRLSVLEANDFDLSKKMGTIWQKERFNFTNLWSIRDAYVQAFYKDYDEIRAAIFDPNLTAIAAARHVLVHNAGFLDQDFIDGVKGVPIFANAKLNDRLFLNGIIVRDLLISVLKSSQALITGVDKWMSTH